MEICLIEMSHAAGRVGIQGVASWQLYSLLGADGSVLCPVELMLRLCFSDGSLNTNISAGHHSSS
jgi:hypothetical protein